MHKPLGLILYLLLAGSATGLLIDDFKDRHVNTWLFVTHLAISFMVSSRRVNLLAIFIFAVISLLLVLKDPQKGIFSKIAAADLLYIAHLFLILNPISALRIILFSSILGIITAYATHTRHTPYLGIMAAIRAVWELGRLLPR